MNKVYNVITERIIQQLEQGTVPWRKPWCGAAFAPRNVVSKRPYRGINAFLLSCSELASPYWLTFKQARQLGGSVRKGERSTPVVFWKWNEVTDQETGEPRQAPILRYYSVFHISQCELPPEKLPPEPVAPKFPFTPIEACQQVVEQMPQRPEIHHQAQAAFYRPSTDSVHMPPSEWFEQATGYYATLFHELAHATGHASRLDREGITNVTPFGTADYSKEELVAEMASAFLCGHCGIETATLDNSASYIQGWLKRLQGDGKLVIHAAAAAQKAADFILADSREEQPTPEAE